MITFKKIYSDGMILQRDTENPIRGNADPDSEIELTLFSERGETVFQGSAKAAGSGLWSVSLPPMKGSFDSFSITASDGTSKAEIKDICFGEVFHISGQSNMELPMSRTYHPFDNEVIEADRPYIREFRTAIESCFDPDSKPDDFAGGCWSKATGSAVLGMSAAGFFFAEEMLRRLDMPIGLVNTAAGGAALEGFMPYEMIKSYGIHDDFLAEAVTPDYMERTAKEDMKREADWMAALGNEDFGMTPSDSMKDCFVPCSVTELEGYEKGFSGRIWFFKKFNIPEDFPTDNAMLILGTVTDGDCAFINGEKVGETGYLYPPRYYRINDGVLKAGENILAVRMEIKGIHGGFTKGKRYCIKSGNRSVELSGKWKYAVAKECEPLKPSAFFQGLPLALHSCMTSPVLPLKFKAMLWYQGESNAGRAYIYKKMFEDYVGFYRKKCGYEIPVISVQLCNFGNEEDDTNSWAKFRQAQLECLDIPKTAMAVTLDIGENNDLHPKNKKEVGRRLARCAAGLLYGDDVSFVKCVSAEYKGKGATVLKFDGGITAENIEDLDIEAVFGTRPVKGRIEITKPDEITFTSVFHGCPAEIRYAYRNAPKPPFIKDMSLMPISPFTIAVKAPFKDTSSLPSLKEAYSGKFRMGIAGSPMILEKADLKKLICSQFNSYTCENSMKPEGILDGEKCRAEPEKYGKAPAVNFDGIKGELDFARDNGMTVRGHTLVWHNQTPEWFFYEGYDPEGKLADRETMLCRMESYIRSVMEWTDTNYHGLISTWDVVNEAVDDFGGLRNSLWRKTVGDGFVSKAFEFARKYAPEGTKLFYNDFNSYKKNKQSDILELLKPIAEAGNMDGVGMQSHLDVMTDLDQYIAALERYHKELGAEIQITELDIERIGNDRWEEEQGDFYGRYMKALLNARDKGIPITSVTLWGFSDEMSWKYKYSPLIFRYDLSPKPSFLKMIEAASEK